MYRSATLAALSGALALSACAAIPPQGPTVVALPSQGKNLTQFQQEDASCRQYAAAQIGQGAAAQAATRRDASTVHTYGNNGADTTEHMQISYNIAYTQCMAASGNRLQTFSQVGPSYLTSDYAYVDPYYYDPWLGSVVGIGFFSGFGHGFRHGGFHHGGFHHGGFGHGGFHGHR